MSQKLWAEFIGTAFLLIGVVGSGIMAEALAGGNIAVALLANAIATGCVLYVIITILGPISGAHFNPAVTLVFWLRGEIATSAALTYVAVQIVGGILGVWMAHMMFDLEILQLSQKARTGPPQWFAEIVATFGLVFVILGGIRHRPEAVPTIVALYITGAYWFTASTSFANPAVTIARSLTDTFAGIFPGHMPLFIVAQCIGATLAWLVGARLFRPA
ncbi:MIP/aquaporin family protein [Pseudoruegeria sp. HB172150]|uniref:aquaporin n=1 Tax=Pseudoruegeria sp. HB172150 TaxID=2721164 RepID=UPI001551E514|nr:MIP/aquaporin family protein [Pseudoruegeria sp. HB172150]